MSNLRKEFAEIIGQLINDEISTEAWQYWIVNHYHDIEVENIRREIVRLSIADKLHTDFAREKLAEWRNVLLGNNV